MITLNNDILHLMQSFLVETEITRTPTCAELFLLGIFKNLVISILCELKIKTLYLKTEASKHKLNNEFEYKQIVTVLT